MRPAIKHPLTLIIALLLATTATRHATQDAIAAAPAPAAAAAAAAAAVDFDLQSFVDGRLKNGERSVVVPPGRYRVAPKNGVHLRLKDLCDVELIADGVEIVCASTTRVVVFENCRNVRFKGLTVDFDPLPFTQGRIVALAPDKKWVEFEIIQGYPENELEERIEIFDPATGELRRETAGREKQIESLGNHHYRATKPKWYRYREDWDTERVGDILVTNNRFPSRATGHAFNAENCTQLKIEDVTLYAASTFGFVEHRCDATTYRRCQIGRRAPEHDPVPRAMPRMRSLNADAFHSTEAGQGPAIIGCWCPQPMCPTVIRLLGAVAPKTEAGTCCYQGDPKRLLVGLLNNDLFADWRGGLRVRIGAIASAANSGEARNCRLRIASSW